MTRYARAKGSKASNERLPNEATPWHVMKQQLVENLSKREYGSKKTASAKKLLENEKNASNSKNVQNTWAKFESTSDKNMEDNLKSNKMKKKKKLQLSTDKKTGDNFSNKHEYNGKKKSFKRSLDKDNESSIKVPKKKKYKENETNGTDTVKTEAERNNETVKTNKHKKNNKNLQVNKNKNNTLHSETNTFSEHEEHRTETNSFQENTSGNSKNYYDNNMRNHMNFNQNENKGRNYPNNKFNNNFATTTRNFKHTPKTSNPPKKRKTPKIRDDKEHGRRKPDFGPSKVMINGIELEIVKFDGFPVKKEDADRLSDLKQKMIMKGIPRKEVDVAIKLERRKAEKSLARVRKCVCFYCRKSGHNLSDCPELGSQQTAAGICFKCGSTEHTHFECKVSRPTEFRYATCFICREQGHIAKQCPDNPKGVYPEGGCCKICGDVTHLKKNCPDLIRENEENTITVNTIEDGNLESLEYDKKDVTEKEGAKTKKIINF